MASMCRIEQGGFTLGSEVLHLFGLARLQNGIADACGLADFHDVLVDASHLMYQDPHTVIQRDRAERTRALILRFLKRLSKPEEVKAYAPGDVVRPPILITKGTKEQILDLCPLASLGELPNRSSRHECPICCQEFDRQKCVSHYCEELGFEICCPYCHRGYTSVNSVKTHILKGHVQPAHVNHSMKAPHVAAVTTVVPTLMPTGTISVAQAWIHRRIREIRLEETRGTLAEGSAVAQVLPQGVEPLPLEEVEEVMVRRSSVAAHTAQDLLREWEDLGLVIPLPAPAVKEEPADPPQSTSAQVVEGEEDVQGEEGAELPMSQSLAGLTQGTPKRKAKAKSPPAPRSSSKRQKPN